MTFEAFIAIAAGLLLPIQGATLFCVVSIERRLTRLETLQEVQPAGGARAVPTWRT